MQPGRHGEQRPFQRADWRRQLTTKRLQAIRVEFDKTIDSKIDELP
jgi:hypothetical protein